MARWRLKGLFDDDPRHVDRFGLLLFLTFVSVVALSLVDVDSSLDNFRSEVGWIAVTATVGLTLIVAVRASGVARRQRIYIEVFVVAVVGMAALLSMLDTFTAADLDSFTTTQPGWLWVALSAVAPLLVVRRLLNHTTVTGRTIAGAISAFLLIALLANYAFLTIGSVQDTPFFGTDEPTTTFMYYSLVTITTLGYGDYAAATEAGRLLSTLEALVGQIFLVTFVATLVSLRTSDIGWRRRNRAAELGSEDAE